MVVGWLKCARLGIVRNPKRDITIFDRRLSMPLGQVNICDKHVSGGLGQCGI